MDEKELITLLYNDFITYDEKVDYYVELSHNGENLKLHQIPELFHTSEIIFNLCHKKRFSNDIQIDRQDDDFFLELIAQHCQFIKYKKNISLDFIKRALEINGGVIQYIPRSILQKNKEELFKLSIDHNSQNLFYCTNPSQELIEHAIKKDVNSLIISARCSRPIIKEILRYILKNDLQGFDQVFYDSYDNKSTFPGWEVHKFLYSKDNDLEFFELLLLEKKFPFFSNSICKSKNYKNSAKGILDVLQRIN